MSDSTWGERFTFIFIGLVVISMIVGVVIQNSNKRTIYLTVTDKTVKNSGSSGKYLIYCVDDEDNIEVLEITDIILRGRFDSSDEYAGIEINKKYRFTIVGQRIPVFSMYPNILSHTEVK